jgi:hypothetical protein
VSEDKVAVADAYKRRANVDIDDIVHGDLEKVKAGNDFKKLGDAVHMVTDNCGSRGCAGERRSRRRGRGEAENQCAGTVLLARDAGRAGRNVGVLHVSARPVVDALTRRLSEVSVSR